MNLGAIFQARVDDQGDVPALTFCVWGHPEPAGSKQAFPRKGAPGRFVVVDDNPKSRSWKALVGKVAAHVAGLTDYPIIDRAVGIRITFLRERPKYHSRADGSLKPDAPDYPDTKPDTTKLLRAVEDALTGVLWTDDAQVVEQHVWKEWSPQEGVEITVWPKPRLPVSRRTRPGVGLPTRRVSPGAPPK